MFNFKEKIEVYSEKNLLSYSTNSELLREKINY
ncbi:Uncharacterised protein [Salmonella enterica subsp. houtenae]|nr:Uncharacterised protein [Salmonella enterica subsp. houtenae]